MAKRVDTGVADTKAKDNPDAQRRPLGQAEALELLAHMDRDVRALREFITDELAVTKKKPPSPKRLARLRLVSEDITSAVNLSSKSFKS